MLTLSAVRVRHALELLHAPGPSWPDLGPSARSSLVEAAALLRADVQDNLGVLSVSPQTLLVAILRGGHTLADLPRLYAVPGRGAVSVVATRRLRPVLDSLYGTSTAPVRRPGSSGGFVR